MGYLRTFPIILGRRKEKEPKGFSQTFPSESEEQLSETELFSLSQRKSQKHETKASEMSTDNRVYAKKYIQTITDAM